MEEPSSRCGIIGLFLYFTSPAYRVMILFRFIFFTEIKIICMLLMLLICNGAVSCVMSLLYKNVDNLRKGLFYGYLLIQILISALNKVI